MKTLYTYIGFLFLALTVLCACTDENEFLHVEEGNDARLTLSVQTQANKDVVVSRASADEMLYDLHFYVFDAQGKLTGYEKMESATGEITSPGPENVTIRTKTGQSYIYAVANINNGSTYILNDSDKNLLNVTAASTAGMADAELESKVLSSTLTKDAFLNINYNRRYSAGEHQNFSPTPTDNIFMMSGYLNDGKSVTIKKDAGGNVSIAEGDHTIKLYRVIAKNTLTINSTGNGKFTPKSYRLYNVPKSGVLVPNANISTANGSSDNYTKGDVISLDVESSYTLSSAATSFTFYYPENLQPTVAGISVWKEREANSYATGNKVFTNAPAKAAYVEIQGDYVSEDGKTTANASYTIHLGNFSTQDRLGDFNVIRNNNYIYTVTVKDVEDIIAEAKVGDAEGNHVDNPYAEGLVVKVGNGERFDVDAHYEARVLTFSKASIQALRNFNNSGYILSINTPFGKTKQTINVRNDGVYAMDGTLICTIEQINNINDASNSEIKKMLFEDDPDFQWMKFVRNTTSNRIKDGLDISKHVCKYPGDGDTTNPRQWLNVFELLQALYDYDTYTETGDEVYYTCFVDENYYADKAWSTYVNKDPRTMQIANNLSVSTDKKSVYAEVAYSISQRSIATFYTKENVKAYGTEIIDEEDLYDVRLGSRTEKYTYYNNMEIQSKHDWNGWTSAKETNKDRNWYTGDNIQTKENIQPLYRAAAKACMSRNRDLNGNGQIDENEVRWYLASVGQYRGLNFAQMVLPADARLISDAELKEIDDAFKGTEYGERSNSWGGDTNGHNFRGRYHYYTSSDKSTAGTFWPEEGLTNNPVEATWGDSRAELVRCVRTLQSDGMGLTDPDLYYTYNDRTFNLDGIKVNRNFVETTLGNHNEVQGLNEFYSSFVVASSDYNNGRTVSMSTITGQSADPCSSYTEGGYSWRTPNQKEIALMLSAIPTLAANNQNYATRTKFSGNDEDYYSWHNSPGFMTSGGVINLSSTTANAKIRCVRDKK